MYMYMYLIYLVSRGLCEYSSTHYVSVSVKEAQSDENKVKAELRKYSVTGPVLSTVSIGY